MVCSHSLIIHDCTFTPPYGWLSYFTSTHRVLSLPIKVYLCTSLYCIHADVSIVLHAFSCIYTTCILYVQEIAGIYAVDVYIYIYVHVKVWYCFTALCLFFADWLVQRPCSADIPPGLSTRYASIYYYQHTIYVWQCTETIHLSKDVHWSERPGWWMCRPLLQYHQRGRCRCRCTDIDIEKPNFSYSLCCLLMN